MSDEAEIPPPRHVLSRKDVWRDVKNRTWVVWDIWTSGKGCQIDLLMVDPTKPQPIEFVTHPWEIVYKMIADGKMSRVM
jgi:hypothetical protein